MGKETISSQELSDYTHVNSTQIRRDLVGLRQVRQARRRLQRRLARRADPPHPPDRRPAQHRAVRGGPPGQGDRLVGHLRRPRLQRRRDLRRRPAQDRLEGRRPAVRDIAELDQVVEEEGIVAASSRCPLRRPSRSLTHSWRPACGSSSTTPTRWSTCRPRSPSTPRARPSTCSTRSTSTSLHRRASTHRPRRPRWRSPRPPTRRWASRRSTRCSTPRRSSSRLASRSFATPARRTRSCAIRSPAS